MNANRNVKPGGDPAAGQKSPSRRTVTLLDVPVDNLDMQGTLDRIEDLVITGRENGCSHQVATVNVDFIVKAKQDPELMAILQTADLTTADGMPLIWASRLLDKAPLKERVAGADMVPLIAERAAQKGFSIYLYGSAPRVAARAAEILKEKYAGLMIAGVYSPPFSKSLEIASEARKQIVDTQPDILLVALGNPKQEKWIAKYKGEIHVPVMIGIGGTLDLITGTMKRAPLWMQQMGLEWLYRLQQEPKRLWKRYVIDLQVFGWLFLRQWISTVGKKFANRKSTNALSIHSSETGTDIHPNYS